MSKSGTWLAVGFWDVPSLLCQIPVQIQDWHLHPPYVLSLLEFSPAPSSPLLLPADHLTQLPYAGCSGRGFLLVRLWRPPPAACDSEEMSFHVPHTMNLQPSSRSGSWYTILTTFWNILKYWYQIYYPIFTPWFINTGLYVICNSFLIVIFSFKNNFIIIPDMLMIIHCNLDIFLPLYYQFKFLLNTLLPKLLRHSMAHWGQALGHLRSIAIQYDPPHF